MAVSWATMSNDFLPDFLIIPYQLMNDESLTGTDRTVYAVIYWYERLKDGKCFASNEEIARVAKTTAATVANSLTALEKSGFIQRIMNGQERKQILTSVRFNTGVKDIPPRGQTTFNPEVNRESNKERVIVNSSTGMDNPYPVKALLDLYGRLYMRRVGVLPTITNYPKSLAMLKKLSSNFTPEQTRAILFCHFEWRGVNGDDDFQLKKLEGAGFPLNLLLYNAGSYATYMRKEWGDEWDNEEVLKKRIDKWLIELSNTN